MLRQNRKLLIAIILSLLVLPSYCPAEDESFELKVAAPGAAVKGYTESFPTEVEATARLWNQLKIDAVEQQTRALREDFEKHKGVWFERPASLAEQTGPVWAQFQPQLDMREQMLFSSVRPSWRLWR